MLRANTAAHLLRVVPRLTAILRCALTALVGAARSYAETVANEVNDDTNAGIELTVNSNDDLVSGNRLDGNNPDGLDALTTTAGGPISTRRARSSIVGACLDRGLTESARLAYCRAPRRCASRARRAWRSEARPSDAVLEQVTR